MIARGGDGDRVASGLVPTRVGLVVDLNGLKDGRVVQVARLVEEGNVNMSRAQSFAVEDVICRCETRNLCPSVRTAVSGETGVDAVRPSWRLGSTTT